MIVYIDEILCEIVKDISEIELSVDNINVVTITLRNRNGSENANYYNKYFHIIEIYLDDDTTLVFGGRIRNIQCNKNEIQLLCKGYTEDLNDNELNEQFTVETASVSAVTDNTHIDCIKNEVSPAWGTDQFAGMACVIKEETPITNKEENADANSHTKSLSGESGNYEDTRVNDINYWKTHRVSDIGEEDCDFQSVLTFNNITFTPIAIAKLEMKLQSILYFTPKGNWVRLGVIWIWNFTLEEWELIKNNYPCDNNSVIGIWIDWKSDYISGNEIKIMVTGFIELSQIYYSSLRK